MSEQQATILQQLAGVWRLVTSEFRTSDGTVMYPLGEDARGQAIFTESGYMSGQLMRGDRPRFQADNQALGTPEEMQEAFLSYMAYCGRCEVDEENRTLTTHVDGSLFPNWTGGDQVRYYELAGDQLVLRTPPIPLGDDEITGILTWQRL